MGIQLVALDMDGTVLLDDHLTVTPAVRRSIEQALAKGVTVVPATGRVAAMLPKVFYELDGIRYVINSNGASVWDRVENRVIYSNPIPAETVRQILQILEPYGLLTQIYCGGNIYAEKRSLARAVDLPFAAEFIENIRKTQIELDSFQALLEEHPEGVEKLNLAHVESGLREKLWKQFEAMPGVTVVSSAGSNIELNRDGASKGDALHHLCQRLQIPPENVMAVGDSGNDVEMLRYAGCSVAMENGTPEAKAAAKYRTASNEQDGVARAIEQFVL